MPGCFVFLFFLISGNRETMLSFCSVSLITIYLTSWDVVLSFLLSFRFYENIKFFFFFEEFVPSVSFSCYVTFCLLSLCSTNSTRGATSFFLSIIPSICTWTDIWPAYSNKYTHLIFISTLFRMTYLILMLMFWLAF